ncbi:MAG TPA: hypothetical protein PKD10_18600 [Paracoccaceae bacterium]|nr:hypothetical protein [Paracoccaceae bacterium]
MRRLDRLTRALAALAPIVILAACAGGEPVTRSNGAGPVGFAAITEAAPGSAMFQPLYNVQEVRVTVPRSLVVSEANLFYPVADIVWRGEPRGDRHEQVRQVVTEAFGFGTAGMRQGPAVIVEVQMRRFHALTEKTRFTVGGVHSIRFDMTVRDAATGAILDGPRFVIADVKASGGRKAMEEDQQGRTQRVVIVEHMSQVIRRELSRRVDGGTPAAAPAVSQGSRAPASEPIRLTPPDMVRTVQMSL